MALNTKSAGAMVAPVEGNVEMVKVKITQTTVCGGVKVKTGQVVDVTESEGRLLINLKKAEPVVGETKTLARKTVKPSTRAKK